MAGDQSCCAGADHGRASATLGAASSVARIAAARAGGHGGLELRIRARCARYEDGRTVGRRVRGARGDDRPVGIGVGHWPARSGETPDRSSRKVMAAVRPAYFALVRRSAMPSTCRPRLDYRRMIESITASTSATRRSTTASSTRKVVGTEAVAGSTEPMRRDLHANGDQRYKLGFRDRAQSRAACPRAAAASSRTCGESQASRRRAAPRWTNR